MASKPTLSGLKLEPCCEKALASIRDKKELGKVLQATLLAGPFATMLGEKPLDLLLGFAVKPTDWDLLARAVKGVPKIVRNRCQLIAGLEVINHAGGDLNRFWRAMYDHFS